VYRLSKLRVFGTSVTVAGGDIFSPPDISLPNPQVQRIEISISLPYSWEINTNERERCLLECHKISEIILSALPRADYLGIIIVGGQANFPFFSLKDYFSGSKMSLCVANTTDMASAETQMPFSVEILSLDCSWSVICLLFSPSLKHLNISQDFSEELNDYGDPEDSQDPVVPLDQQMDLNSWPCLETISLYKNWIRWGESSLTSLRCVTIQAPKENEFIDNVTYFVKEIACHPESYPALEEIHLGEYPELDTLFIMLERRNLLASSTIKRIKKLGLPPSLPDKFYQMLGELLRCKWINRPSNRELSLSGNAKSILDSNM
jgi:hypothetical protein